MTTGTAIGASLSVPGRPDQVHAARVFTSEALGDDHPCAPVAVLLVSELVTNSVLHSDSRLPGGIDHRHRHRRWPGRRPGRGPRRGRADASLPEGGR